MRRRVLDGHDGPATRLWALLLAVAFIGLGCSPEPLTVEEGQRPRAALDEAAQARLSLRAAFIAAVQQSADATYALAEETARGETRAINPSQRLRARLRAGVAELRSLDGTWWLELRWRGVGRGRLAPVPPARCQEVLGGQARFDHGGGLGQWFVNGPLGLEQGFTLERAPTPGTEPLVLQLELDTNLSVELDADRQGLRLRDERGRVALRYTDLLARDADGVILPAWMGLSDGSLSLQVDDRGARYPVEVDPLIWGEQLELHPSDAGELDQFGHAVDIHGDLAAVGAPEDDEKGAVYLFERVGSSWIELQKISAGDIFDHFGTSVSLVPPLLAVGAPGVDYFGQASGAAYVFVQSSTWHQEDMIFSSNPGSGRQFGISVSILGDSLIVGQPGTPAGGTVHVFGRLYLNPIRWMEQDVLTASDAASSDRFGASLALDSGVVVVGAPGQADAGQNSGAAYVFSNKGFWSEDAKLTASTADAGDKFGAAVALDGARVAVSAVADEGGGTVHVFENTGSAWDLMAELGSAGAVRFGTSLSLDGNRLVVGDDGDSADTGAAYLFEEQGGSWTQQVKLGAGDGLAGELFGTSLAIAGDTVVVGAPFDGDVAPAAGGVYVFNWASDLADGCTQASDCYSGFCVDGVCCDSACDDSCESCLASDTGGADGTCAPVAALSDPAGDCGDGELCDGAGLCKRLGGEYCFDPSSCLTGFCVDGICCEDVCDGFCEACSAAKTGAADGICSPVTSGTDPDAECAAGEACNGAGSCAGILGQSCGAAAGCISGYCVDGVCCDGACGGSCESCIEPGHSGQCTTFAAGAVGSPSCAPLLCDGVSPACPTTCSSNEQCADSDQVCLDGTCTTLTTNGDPCTDDARCESGACVDGLCCREASCGAYRCGPGGLCLEQCSGSGDCAEGHACDSSASCVAVGVDLDAPSGCGCTLPGAPPRRLPASWPLLLLVAMVIPGRRAGRRS